jgi:histidine ammonia-lyase
MNAELLEVKGHGLRLEDVERVAQGAPIELSLSADARQRVLAARAMVEQAVNEGRVVYGLTTGFGALAEVVIPPERIRELQVNLIRSHAAGVGEPLPEREARAVMGAFGCASGID